MSEHIGEMNRKLQLLHQMDCPECQQAAAQTRKEIALSLEKFMDWDGESMRTILPREWNEFIETLKQGESIERRKND